MPVKKVVILAGGLGTRLSEETGTRPKPLVEIGGRPILWHVMKIYYAAGIREFVICLGYKGYMIKEFFANYDLHTSDVTIDHINNEMIFHERRAEDWRVTLVDTGDETLTGGRVKRVKRFVGDEDFCMTYGDGVADIDIKELIAKHEAHGKEATITVVTPPGRFGAIDFEGDSVVGFREKPSGESGWINGGFFILSPKVFDRIKGDHTTWEKEPLEGLAGDGELVAHKHTGFWHPMDTLRDKRYLDDLLDRGKAPWRIWG